MESAARSRNGANVNAVNRSGRTPLMGAAFNGHEAVVRLLLDSGADVNFRGRDGATALTYSATADRKEVVQLLLERGAHRWIRDRHNQTPYQFALSTNNMPMARLLDQRDIVANLPDEVSRGGPAWIEGLGRLTRRRFAASCRFMARGPPGRRPHPRLLEGLVPAERCPRLPAVVPARERQGAFTGIPTNAVRDR